jgi:hypothetical protein
LPGNFISEAKGINNLLWVVGTSGSEYASTNYERYDKPFLWVPHAGTLESGTMQELPCDRDSNDDGILDISVCPSAIRGSANAINDAGLIGGKLGGKPYLWWNGQGYDISSWLPPLIDLGGGYYASNTDLIACEVTSVSNSYAYTIVCPGAFNFELGQSVGISFISTPSVPGFTRVDARLNAVNDEGCAVGTVIPRVGATMTAVKYCNGTLTDLNTTTVSKSGRLAEALDINNRGQILVKINDRPRPAPQNQITALLVPRP